MPNYELFFGFGSGATGNYNMHGGTLTVGDIRTDSGTGNFYQDGGIVTSIAIWVRLGIYAGSNSTYNLAGGTLSFNAAMFTVGETGNGMLTIGGFNGGTLVASNTTTLAVASGSGNGTLNLQAGGLLKAANIVQGNGTAAFNFSGGTIENTPSSNLTVAMPVNLAGQATVAVDNGQTTTFQPQAVLSGTGGLTKGGLGTLVLQASNTYTGPTVITGGILQSGAVTSFGGLTPQLAYNFTTGSAINEGSNSGVATTLTSSPAFSATGGPNGLGVMSLNGSNYLQISSLPFVGNNLPDLSGGAYYTIGVWIKTTVAGASLLYKGDGVWNFEDELFYLNKATSSSGPNGAGGYVGGVQNGDGFVGGGVTVNTGSWEYVTYVRSGGSSTTYVNGAFNSKTTGMLLPEEGTQTIDIGYNAGDTSNGAVNFSGSISGVTVFNTALTVAQVNALYQSGLTNRGSLPAATDVSITAAGAALDIAGNRQSLDSLSGAPGSAVYLGGGTLAVTGGRNTVFAGNISDAGGVSSGTGGVLVVNGNGGLSLTGSNSYLGGTVVNGGTLSLGYNNGAEGTLQGPLTINQGGTVVAAVNNALGYAGSNWVQAINIHGGVLTTSVTTDNGWGTTISMTGGTVASSVAGGYFVMGTSNSASPPTFNITGTNTPALIIANLQDRGDNGNPGITFNITRGSAASDLNISGTIVSVNTATGITERGNGIMTLSGNNAYFGGTTISGGVLQVGSSAALGSNNGPLLLSSGTLDVHGNSINVGQLTGAGTIDNQSGNGSLTVGNGDASGTFSGTIEDSVGSLAIVKAGAGMLVLSGTASYTGGTTVLDGTLDVAVSNALPVGGGLTIGAGASLMFGASQSGQPIAAASLVSSIAAAPEPSTLTLLTLAAISALLYRKRKARL